MTTLAALTTPCLLLEDEKLQANMDRLARRLHERGVSLRPHLKTCKNREIARRCMESPTGPATVSTLAEAEYFAAGGVRDICYAVGIAPNKLERVAGLRRRGADCAPEPTGDHGLPSGPSGPGVYAVRQLRPVKGGKHVPQSGEKRHSGGSVCSH